MKKTIGILAHVDAGKTTFAEQILFHTKSIRNKGRVDHKNSFLDSHDIEKERGITVFSDQAVFEYNLSTYYLIDTPGHVDFSTEMERAISVMDYAIIIVSGVEGIQGHTETVWQLLIKHRIPVFFFINKIDRDSANPLEVLDEIRTNMSKDVICIDDSFENKNMSGELIEFIAEREESLLEKYLDTGYEKELWLSTMINLIREGKLYPCLFGSALQDIKVIEFIQKLDMLTCTDYAEIGDFSGRVFKIRHDEQRNRITFIKVLSGRLKVRDEVWFGDSDNRNSEKVSGIRIYNGNKYKTVDEAFAGDLVGLTGLSEVMIGEFISSASNCSNGESTYEKIRYDIVPTLKSKVIFDKAMNPKEILDYFKILEAEDPALNVIWEEKLQELQIHIMGVIQLEVLKQILEDRFKIKVEFGPCEILYKETITETSKGYGHFEPLGHYSEVNLLLEPGERKSGIVFENKCHADDLTTGFQNLIRTHIFEKEHHGILTGSALTDIKITLITGRAHNKHTSGGDFREATFRALRQGLERANNIVLEPYYIFKIEAELDYMGRILSDIQKFHGTFEAPQTILNKIIIIGRGPVATFMNYSVDFTSLTKGKGKINFIFDGFDICHNADEVILKKNYNKNADMEYTSTSIFCSKGQSYLVKGEDAEEYMHCLVK